MAQTRKRRRKPDVLEMYVLPALLLVFFGMVALFWGNISWVVNGDVWRQLLSDQFPQLFPRPYVMVVNPPLVIKQGAADVQAPIQTQATSTSSAPVAQTPDVIQKPRHDSITIPKIGVTAPIITAQTTNATVIHGLLDSGVVLYPGSMPFGQVGQTVILGHSAPPGWPKIKFDWVFSHVNELKTGDMIVINYNNETRYYQVVKTRVVTPQEGVPEPTVDGNSLMIVSCWPPGKDLKRIAIESTIVDQ